MSILGILLILVLILILIVVLLLLILIVLFLVHLILIVVFHVCSPFLLGYKHSMYERCVNYAIKTAYIYIPPARGSPTLHGRTNK